jgi:anti-sigma regulatory factor (Ser/Thr protein kinase)
VTGFEHRLASEASAASEAEHHVGEWLDSNGVDADKSRDVLTVTSTLVTSGVRHGGRSPIDVRAWAIANDVYVEVVTGPVAADEPIASARDDVDDDLRGLGIVARLTDGMAVRERGQQSGVCARFDLEGR